MVKKWFLGQKLSISRASAIIALNTHFWVKNHFFTTITPKPAYIYPNNFSREIFSKKIFGPLGPPWGTWGPYLEIPSVEYFPNVVFWTSWAPWSSPYLQKFWDPPKNLNFFQGAVCRLSTSVFLVNCFIQMLQMCPFCYFTGTSIGCHVKAISMDYWIVK